MSDNVLDVSSALDLSLFSHMTIRCNRKDLNSEQSSAIKCTDAAAPMSKLGKDKKTPKYFKFNYIRRFFLNFQTAFTLLPRWT